MNKEELLALGETVASHLGADWKANMVEDSWRPIAELKRPDGATVSLVTNGARLSVKGVYPTPYNYLIKRTPNISVALHRGAETIARNIQRRFLPDYLATYAKGAERVRQLLALATLATIIQEQPGTDSVLRFSIPWVNGMGEAPWQATTAHGHILLTSSAAGEFELHYAPVALVAKLLEIVREWQEGKKA